MQLEAGDAASAKDQSLRQYAPGTRAFIAQCLNHASKRLRLGLAHLPESVAIFGRNPQRGRALKHVGHGWMLFYGFVGFARRRQPCCGAARQSPKKSAMAQKSFGLPGSPVEPGR